MRRVLLLAFLLMCPGVASADLCSDVKRAIDGERDNWAQYRGAYDPDTESYESRLLIGDFRECFIDDDADDPRFTCSRRAADEITADREADSLFKQVKACLGNKPMQVRTWSDTSSTQLHDSSTTYRVLKLGIERVKIAVTSGRVTRKKSNRTTYPVHFSVTQQ